MKWLRVNFGEAFIAWIHVKVLLSDVFNITLRSAYTGPVLNEMKTA